MDIGIFKLVLLAQYTQVAINT